MLLTDTFDMPDTNFFGTADNDYGQSKVQVFCQLLYDIDRLVYTKLLNF